MERHAGISLFATLVVVGAAMLLTPMKASAHCDTMDGPVVTTAKLALEKSDVTPVLKWVRKADEGEIREQFKKTLIARKQGKEAGELSDRYFFETLVRIHRAGEGAPYTGLKPAGQIEPSIAAADKALETGSVDSLVKLVTDASAAGIRERFVRVSEAKKHVDESVEKGREFVEAYVDFTHYVERLHMDALARGAHHEEMQKEMMPMKHEGMGAEHMHQH